MGSLFAYPIARDTTSPEDHDMKDTEIRSNKIVPMPSDEASISAPADTKVVASPRSKERKLQTCMTLFKVRRNYSRC